MPNCTYKGTENKKICIIYLNQNDNCNRQPLAAQIVTNNKFK